MTLIALMEKTGTGGSETGGRRYAEHTRATADVAFTKVGLAKSGCAVATRTPTPVTDRLGRLVPSAGPSR